MARKSKSEPTAAEPEQAQAESQGIPMPPGGSIVFQHPATKGFVAWAGPTVKELVAEKANDVMQAEMEHYKAITIRPTVQDVELLDELATLFRQSRNETACALLGAALREALNTLPDHIRERVQVEAFKRLGWGIAVAQGTAGEPAERPSDDETKGK